ncbi:hypothetical protein RRG08_006999 [Elysia crispata]|uniref:Uncharacterized protein n=1 Tax=Elysia crispata TaxID=231223 RepID=A0AAE1B0E9_9GAST|nr:hypothetical protein RRG08_006999 [Elysia crispata]
MVDTTLEVTQAAVGMEGCCDETRALEQGSTRALGQGVSGSEDTGGGERKYSHVTRATWAGREWLQNIA